MVLQTERLILRRWEDSDAEQLFKYAKDPDVGPITGWPPHKSIDESRYVIANVLNGKEAYAICLKEDNKAIGAIELRLYGTSKFCKGEDECELGFWLGKPFWGQGIMPEASRELIRHGFEDCGMNKIWCGYYEGNSKSMRAQEKIGFKFQYRQEDVDVPLLNEKRVEIVNLMTREDWLNSRRIIAACGNDCSVCPRYNKAPYVKTEKELHHTAELWLKIGYRDHVVTNEEISCYGCKPENWCRYKVVKCTMEHGVETCGKCPEYPCGNIKECLEVTKSFEPMCKKMCTDEEYEIMRKAFFEKEKNLIQSDT